MKHVFAVIDTNVIVSALLTKNPDSPTVRVVESVLSGQITPLYHNDILREYNEVLHRPKFHLSDETVRTLVEAFRQFGTEVEPKATGQILPDMDDLIFYEVTMEKQDSQAYLVTGNIKHFPNQTFIVTPSEMMAILENSI